VTIHGDTDRGDVRCGERDQMSSHLLRGTLISQCPKATKSIAIRIRSSGHVVNLALGLTFAFQAVPPKLKSIPVPGMKPFPESITSTWDGVLFVGRVGDGGIVRIKPRTGERTAFVRPGALGSRSILGVFADEGSNTLWACSNDLRALGGPAIGHDTSSALKGFDLKTGAGKLSVSLPGPHAYCNDIA